MEVTPIGWILLVAGPVLMIVRPRWLYIVTIFSLPFTATDLLNVGSGLTASGLQASMYFGSLLILRYAISFLRRGKLPFPHQERTSLIWLGLFIATTIVSLVMPLWIDGRVQIPSASLIDSSSEPLYLGSHNITAVLYMIYGYLFAYLIAVLNRETAVFWLSLKTFMAGSIFAAFWAILELICKVSGIEYPALIFNTGTSMSAMGYKEALSNSVFRLSSVAVEPSIFAQILLAALSLYLPFVFGAFTLFGKALDRWFFALLLMVLCLTTSSTGYLGILMMAGTVLAMFTLSGILRLRDVVIPLAGLGAAALLYENVPVVRQVLEEMLFSKADSYSALERLMTITNAYQMFLKYPALGIGWASIASHDLIVNILANAGILGMLFFTLAIYFIFRALYRSIKARSKSLRVSGLMRMDFALYVAFAVTLATSALSGFLSVFSFFWFVCGLAIAASGAVDILTEKSHPTR